MVPLPHRDLRHPWLRYQVDGYNEGIVHSYEQRLKTIWGRAALFTSHAWRRLFEIRAPLVREFMLELFSTCRMSDTKMGLDVADTLCFQLARARRGRHLRRHVGGHFIGRLSAHFGLVGDQGLRGLSVVVSELPVIDLHKLTRLNICLRFGDTWAWVAPGPERQQADMVGVPRATEDALAADQGTQAIPAPMQAHQLPLPAPQHRTMS
ncbi:hypothetical protein Tco_0185772 [Tanacetum coccineum]